MSRNYTNKSADLWYDCVKENIESFPFSFVYGGIKYEGFGSEDFTEKSRRVCEEGGRETVYIQFDLKGELTVNLKLSHYASHGVTEWTVEFENNTDSDTKVISEPKMELILKGENPILKGSLGDHDNKL